MWYLDKDRLLLSPFGRLLCASLGHRVSLGTSRLGFLDVLHNRLLHSLLWRIQRLLSPNTLAILVNMQTPLQLLAAMSQINLDLFRTPRLWSSKAGKQPHKPSLKACGEPNHPVSSSLFVDRVLRPFANGPLEVHLVDVGEASGFNLLFHDVGDVGGVSRVLRGAMDNVAEFAEARSLWQWAGCEGFYWRVYVDVLNPSAWLKVAT